VADIEARTLRWLEQEIGHHRTWRRIWSFLYFFGASLTVIAGALATVTAGFMDVVDNGPLVTALLAALATVMASLEKVLKLKEKWDLHRNVQTALEMILLRGSAGLLDTEKALALIEKTAVSYSVRLAGLGGDDQDA
jgi:hypothetical protein